MASRSERSGSSRSGRTNSAPTRTRPPPAASTKQRSLIEYPYNDELALKLDRTAERIDDAVTESGPLRAVSVKSELQVETADLAPEGPNVERARRGLREVGAVLRAAIEPDPIS
jgi:hypothetical protein